MPRVTDEELNRVVQSYKGYISAGELNPATLVSKEWGVSTKTIYNLLKVARRRNLLPTAGQGRTWSLDTWEWSENA
jgi:hypothetical protein